MQRCLCCSEIVYEYESVNLLSGDHKSEEYSKKNPLNLVPALESEDGIIVDSVAILEYLEEKFPERPLLPEKIQSRNVVRQIVNLIAANIQPLQNFRVLISVEQKLGSEEKLKWAQKWIIEGFEALESILRKTAGKYCVGNELTLADVVLIPQVGNANRFQVEMAPFPVIARVTAALYELPLVQNSIPQKQPDAQC